MLNKPVIKVFIDGSAGTTGLRINERLRGLDGVEVSALPEELAPSFMNAYIAFTDIEFSSYSGLGRDGLSAETVTAGDGSSVLSAYLINDGNSCIWLLFSCPADDAETMREMDAMRDSFNILAG